ncbi:HDOD domain-containing protein [Dethiothermospora halolimnae]|uniref:HDOD domain-containing protein n=1 Tax=Dethiothermospora halolimnae TaxID=3114390 RepID=UPI003CCC2741
MERNILIVDDEKQILRSLNRLFLDTNYIIHLANGGKEALEILDRQDMDMIITDIRMPLMDGYQLLKEVKKGFPSVLRVALSGYTDNDKILRALEGNLAKLYMFKPWDNEKLLDTIKKIFELEDILKDKHILTTINNLDQLPTIPNLHNEVCKLIENDADIDSIAKKIEEDQSISSRLLRISNSAFWKVKTGSIKSAIMYIGLLSTKNIVISNSLYSLKSVNGFIEDLLWKQVNITNKLLLFLYDNIFDEKIPETYRTAGLLHNIGVSVLLANYKKDYTEIIGLLKSNNEKGALELERNKFGVTHQEIGGYLLNWWELPYPMVEGALFHHDPLNENIIHRELVILVYLAKHYAWRLLGYKEHAEELDKEVFKVLGITENECEKLIEKFDIEE